MPEDIFCGPLNASDMSSEALQRTVRRTGAVVVVAVSTLSMGVLNYAAYSGYPVGVADSLTLLLLAGSVLYLTLSVLVGGAAKLDSNAGRERSASGDGGGASGDRGER